MPDTSRLWRVRADSSDRAVPLAMVRVLVALDELDATVAAYARILDTPCDLRFDYPQAGLRLASVGPVLVIAGDDAALEPFRATDATFLVADLHEAADRVTATGGVVLEEPKAVPTGRNMLARHADGLLVEYVEHRPQPGESPS